MGAKLINLGYGNAVLTDRIVAILTPATLPVKRIQAQAQKDNRLIDVTCGRKTRAVIITDSDHIILSGFEPQTLCQRIDGAKPRRGVR